MVSYFKGCRRVLHLQVQLAKARPVTGRHVSRAAAQQRPGWVRLKGEGRCAYPLEDLVVGIAPVLQVIAVE